jgi:4-hydroxy-2-oxoheptanedioate aldolase
MSLDGFPSVPWRRVGRTAQVGTVLTMPGAASAELLAEPFDLVWIDLEHAALGRTEAQQMILGAQATGSLAYVRVSKADAGGLVGPMLDAGADGIVGADVRDESQATWLAALTRYPPVGRRGYGPRRSALRHRIRRTDPPEPPQLWAQLESQQGVGAAEEIARVDGIDGLIIGIADLCCDLGAPVGLADSRVQDAIRVVGQVSDGVGVRFGLAGPLHEVDELGGLIDAATVLIHSTDARICAAAADNAAQALRLAAGANRAVSGDPDG